MYLTNSEAQLKLSFVLSMCYDINITLFFNSVSVHFAFISAFS